MSKENTFGRSKKTIYSPKPSNENIQRGDYEEDGKSCNMCSAKDTPDMVMCDKCDLWYHFNCVGVDQDIEHRDWVCENCADITKSAHRRERPEQQNEIGKNNAAKNINQANGGQLKPKSSCMACTAADTIEMGKCTKCDQWFHFNCVGIDSNTAKMGWLCNKCKNSKSIVSTSTTRRKKLLELERLEEERILSEKRLQEETAIKEKRDKEFLDKKYKLLNDMVSDTSSNSNCNLNFNVEQTNPHKQTKDWVEKHKNPINTGAYPKGTKNHTIPQLNNSKNKPINASVQDDEIQPHRYRHDSPNHKNKDIEVNSNTGKLTREQIAARQVLTMKSTLPYFSGDPIEWPIFISSFLESTRKCGFTQDENLIRLQQSLKGKALEAVRSMLLLPDTVPIVIKTLEMLFGRKELIISTLLHKIRNEPVVKPDKLEMLIHFAITVQHLCATIEASGLTAHLNSPIIMQEILNKLPTQIKLNWAIYKRSIGEINLSDLSEWLYDIAEAASDVSVPLTPNINNNYKEIRSERRTRHHNEYVQAAHMKTDEVCETNKHDSDHTRTCCVCNSSEHKIDGCPKFKALSRQEKWQIVISKKRCRGCLGPHHTLRCKSKTICGIDGCPRKHHPSLHNSSIPANENTNTKLEEKIMHNTTADEVVDSTSNVMQNKQKVLFRVIPVILHGKNSSIKTFAFLDDGSSVTLLEENLAKSLELEGPKKNLCLKWTANTTRNEAESRIVSFSISGLQEGSRKYRICNARTVKRLDLPVQSLDLSKVLLQNSHLDGLPVMAYENETPRILIGLDNWHLGLSLEVREGSFREPVAARTRLGWTIYGPYNYNSLAQENYNYHVCECQSKTEDSLHQLVKEFFSIENFGVKKPETILESSEDKRAKFLLQSTTAQVNNRYKTGLLWKYDEVNLPDSYLMAQKRLECLERKILKNPGMVENLNYKIQDYIEKGYARKLAVEERVCNQRVWYLPIFTVINSNKPEKVRLVWDAAATVNGTSLNSVLLKGPDQLTLLPTILYKFRERKVAICGDIKEMFHQIQVIEDDQHSQRFLWRNCDQSRAPDIYVMQVMTFGATCSPSSAQYIKNINADKFKFKFPRAVSAIKDNHYVDDWLDSFDSIDEAVKIILQVKYIHAQAGFEIRNWLSSSTEVLKKLGEHPVVEQKIFLQNEVFTEKVLGMWWCTTSDSFCYVVNRRKLDMNIMNGKRRPTKREVLRLLMTIFDPLGLIAFFLVYVKILLQELWRLSVDWDEEIPESLYEKWLVWANLVHAIESIRIPRCYSLIKSEMQLKQLHVFVDASENAYAAVAYVRMVYKNEIQVTLVGSKTKVAPQKPLSIPRLELQAAVLGARLMNSVCDGHSLKFQQRFLWSDSKTVLCWLNSDARKYRQFVAMRIGEILETTDVKEWRWIPTQLNVADEATKWKGVPVIAFNTRWFQGPEFLLSSEDLWPKGATSTTIRDQDEIKICFLHNEVINLKPITPKLTSFSSWNKLVNSQCYLMRALNIFTSKIKGHARQIGPFDVDEINKAKNILYRSAQWDAYKEEIVSLTKQPNAKIDKSSSLYKLSPYLDSFNVLRMRGRIDAIDVSPDMKRPVILPKDHPITTLLISWYHIKYLHHNHETVVNEVRQLYVIPKLRVALKKIRNNCQKCKNNRSSPQSPEMGNLPISRMSPFIRPFSYVGVDYFGPIEVVVGRHTEKRWGVLFTCLTIRAIHLEIATKLSTDSCIQCLRCFIARRGTPVEIISDNGTNFRGAHAELKNELKNINSDNIKQHFTSIKWKFIPPNSPHMGGSWERLIRTVKSNIMEVMPTRKPTDEVLRSCFLEIEGIINSRPLTFVSIDPEEKEAITPNHFLLGSSSGIKPPTQFLDDGVSLKNTWKTSQVITDRFWKRWVSEYLPTLTKRTKWFEKCKPIEVGDVVVIVDSNNPRNCWPKGIVEEVINGKDDQIRSVKIRTATGILTRPAVKVAVLDVKANNSKPLQPDQLTRGECITTTDFITNF